MITDERMEKLIAELYEENIRDMEIDIDMEALIDKAYAEVEAREKERAAAARRKKFKSAVKAAVVFIGILVLSLAVFEPEQGYADVFRFMFDRDARGNEVISDNLIGEETAEDVVEYTVTLEELDEVAGFHVPVPGYIPERYQNECKVRIIKGYEEILSLYISYADKNSWQMVVYNVIPVDKKRVRSIVLDIPKEEVEEIAINDHLYLIYCDEEKEKTAVYWEINEYMYSIDGNISKEEAIKIVESIE